MIFNVQSKTARFLPDLNNAASALIILRQILLHLANMTSFSNLDYSL